VRLLSLEVEHFRAIRSARLTFGRGLNVVHGPNDRGKSTLTETIRAALLVAPGSAEARSFATWGAPPGQFPKVVLTFEAEDATWRLEKLFASGSRAKASLDKSTDGGERYQPHAQGRDVEGKLRELLRWGLAAPGGRGAAQRGETFLITALLGKQGEVSALFQASLKSDQDDSGRTLVTRALDALGQDPQVTKLLERLKDRAGEVFTASGRHRRTADSPLFQAQQELNAREKRVESLEELARQSRQIEEQVVQALQARERALEQRDTARAQFDRLRADQALSVKREQLDREAARLLGDFERIAAGANALEAARQEQEAASQGLVAAEESHAQAASAAKLAEDEALAARERLAQARALHQSSEELAAAHGALHHAEQDASRTEAELNLATVWQELQDARILTATFESAAAEYDRETAREAAASAALKTASAELESARQLEQQARTAGDEHAMKLRLLEARILHAEATVRDEQAAADRGRGAVLQVGRADRAQAAANAADAAVAAIEAGLAADAVEIAQCEQELRSLDAAALDLRRRASELRDRAGRVEATRQLPQSAALSSIAGIAAAAVGFILARFVFSVDLPLSIAAALIVGAAVAAALVLTGGRRRGQDLRGDAERSRQEAAALDREADTTLNGSLRARERLDDAQRSRSTLQTQQMRQAVASASARAQADQAQADLERSISPGVDPQAAVIEAESRLREAEAQLNSLRRESRQLPEPDAIVSDPKAELDAAQIRVDDLQRERQAAIDSLARAEARLDLVRHAAEEIDLAAIEQRVAAAQAAVGAGTEPPDPASASLRHDQAKQRLSSASAAVDLLAARTPTAAPDLDSGEAVREAELAATSAGQQWDGAKARLNAATANRDRLRGRAERARGDLESSQRHMQGVDIATAEQALAQARAALAELPPAPEVTAAQLRQAEEALENSEAELKSCEGSLNEVRGKLDLVGGRAGIERLEEEREAVQRAREHAEDQELEYEASRHTLSLLEAAEAKRSSHLGRTLAVPVAERFRAMAGDLYGPVNLDSDLKVQGFVAIGEEHQVEELSVGTREQLATIIRLAIAAQLKTAVLLDDQLVHSDSHRIEWFRNQVRQSVTQHDHQVIVMTCRLSDYAAENEDALTIISILDVLDRVKA
jgi:hypothetical protein